MNTFFDSLDNVTRVGRFFVTLTQRLGESTVVAGEDAKRLAHAFVIPIPPELKGSSIESMEDNNVAEQAMERRAERSPLRITVIYPPVFASDPGQVEVKFKRCFQVCQTVRGVKVCAEVCVDIDVGLGGASGKITATVLVAF